jgi:hypothetical protein
VTAAGDVDPVVVLTGRPFTLLMGRPTGRCRRVQAVDAVDAADLARQARRLSMWARVVLVPVAVIGAVLSYQSLYKAAQPTFGPYLAGGFPLLVDLLILGASLQYVAGAKIGRPMTGWRLTAHCGVAGTLVLNALAARELGEVPWHVTAPAVWAVLVELTGKQVLGQWRATHQGPAASIAPSLWMSSPLESFRTRLLMARTGANDAHEARISVGTAAAAREALNLSLPRRSSPRRDARRVRRVVNRQLRAGSLPPQAVMEAVGWTSTDEASTRSPEVILRAVVRTILTPSPVVIAAEERSVVVLPEADPLPRPTQSTRPVWVDEDQVEDELAAELAAAVAPDPAVTYAPAYATSEPTPPYSARVETPLPASASDRTTFVASERGPSLPSEPTQHVEPAQIAQPVAQPAQVPTAPMPSGDRAREPLSMWAAAQVRTNGPSTQPIPASPRSADRQDWADVPAAPNEPISRPEPPVQEATYGAWSPVPPYKPMGPVTPTADGAAYGRLDPEDEDQSLLDTGSMPTLSGRPTVKQKEERLAIAVRIVHRRPEITGAELRAELEREGWLVSDRTAARILGEARVTPPLRAVKG